MDEALPGHVHQAQVTLAACHPGVGRDPITFHEGDGDHVHEMSVGRRGELVEYIWKVENVELATVGIDIGSSTSHLMFATVRLQRKTQALSSQFVVVERRILWKSPILLTPFAADGSIDARRLGEFIARCYQDAGLARGEVDTGAVILTGEAIKRVNARAIADLFAADCGNFVCASAGHHLESALAAHGSGAVALSRERSQAILNVDIGGGTTKLALAAHGEVLSTCAFAVGGRLLAFDAEGRIARIDDSARLAADHVGVALRIGEPAVPDALLRVVDALADAAISIIAGEKLGTLAQSLTLTDVLPSPSRGVSPLPGVPPGAVIERQRAGERVVPAAITFSGGVSEYIYGRETRDFGDIAPLLAGRISAACRSGRIATPVSEPREGIRATVIGASQFTVQVSGKTIHVSEAVRLPLRNVPVVAPILSLGDEISPAAVAAAIQTALARAPSDDEGHPIALAIRWTGEPHYRRLRGLAEGIAAAFTLSPTRRPSPRPSPKGEGEQRRGRTSAPLVLMIDGDVGRTLGHVLEHELRIGRAVVSIDGIQLREFDFVDIGEMINPAGVVPVVIKSLLFSGAPPHASREAAPTYKSVMETRLQ